MNDSVRIGDAVIRRGDAISIDSIESDGLHFVIDQINRYVSGEQEWFEASGMCDGQRVFVEHASEQKVCLHLDQAPLSLDEIGLTEDDLIRMDEARSQAESFVFDGTTWYYQESAEIVCFQDCGPQDEGCYNWDACPAMGNSPKRQRPAVRLPTQEFTK